MFSQQELADIALGAHEFNRQNRITGLLVYIGEHFLQVIEGTRGRIEHLYKKIESDPRHTNVLEILNQPISERSFSNWSMGVLDLSSDSNTETQAVIPLLREARSAPEQHRTQILSLMKKLRPQTNEDCPKAA